MAYAAMTCPAMTQPAVSPSGRAARIVLATLAVDGILSAVAGAFLLPVYLGPVPVPISGLVSGMFNAALVWAASHWTDSKGGAALPLWTWLATVGVMTLGGPGGDLVLAGPGVMGYALVVLLVLGVVPPVAVLRRIG